MTPNALILLSMALVMAQTYGKYLHFTRSQFQVPSVNYLHAHRLSACHTDDKEAGHQNQEWTYNSNGTVTSVISGKCMEAETAIGNNDLFFPDSKLISYHTTTMSCGCNAVGSNVQLNSCSGGDNQRWMYDNTTGELKGLKSGLCVDVGSTASCQQKPWSDYPYCNTALDPLKRAQDLVARMEVAEMVCLLISYNTCISIHTVHSGLTTNVYHCVNEFMLDWTDGQ